MVCVLVLCVFSLVLCVFALSGLCVYLFSQGKNLGSRGLWELQIVSVVGCCELCSVIGGYRQMPFIDYQEGDRYMFVLGW